MGRIKYCTEHSIEILKDSNSKKYFNSIKDLTSDRAKTVLGYYNDKKKLPEVNPFVTTQLGSLRIPLASRENIEEAISHDNSFLRGNYIDVGLGVITGEDSYAENNLISTNLASQLKEEGIHLGRGKFIPYQALKLREDSKSLHGLAFDLDKKFLKLIRDIDEFEWKKIATEGVVRAMLRQDGRWYLDYHDLKSSLPCGRIVTVNYVKPKKGIIKEQIWKK